MELQITTLIENNVDDAKKLICEHGLSLYIEIDGKKILFDAGQSGDFIKNAKTMNKDLNALDFCIISHGHYDHSGGFEKFVSEVTKLPELIVGEEFFFPKYKTVDVAHYKFIGNSFDETYIAEHQISLRKIKEEMVFLTEHVVLFHHFTENTDYEKRNKKFFVKRNSEYIPDDFDDEIALGIITKKGLVVIAGCSHVGIITILKTITERIHVPIYGVIGGTHLVDAQEDRIKNTIDTFKKMNIKLIAVSHCTGEEGVCFIRENLKKQFVYNNTGNVIQI